MKKKILPLLLAAAMILALAGCGRAKPGSTAAAPETTAATASATAAAPETAPETTLPETTAPETAAPEPASSAAPQTEAHESTDAPESTEDPAAAALDYALPENWAYFALGDNKPVDVFLICPTVDTRSERNALDLNEKLKGRFVSALDAEKGIYEEMGRLYSPYYRQMSIKAYSLPEEDRAQALQTAYRDLADAFRWYLDHENEDRGIILAGFSQGAEMCLELLKDFYGGDSLEAVKLRANLVAVYAIGWHLTQEMTEKYPQIIPAAGERDTGSVVCFDCEDGTLAGTAIIPEGITTLSVNPLNCL